MEASEERKDETNGNMRRSEGLEQKREEGVKEYRKLRVKREREAH